MPGALDGGGCCCRDLGRTRQPFNRLPPNLDRFFAKVDIAYPSEDEEQNILRLAHRGVVAVALDALDTVAGAAEIASARDELAATTVSDEVLGYLAAVVRRTRDLPSVALGASPRAGMHLLAAARGAARLAGRDFVTPDDVASMATPVLHHRLVLRPEAELERYTNDQAVQAALAAVRVPR